MPRDASGFSSSQVGRGQAGKVGGLYEWNFDYLNNLDPHPANIQPPPLEGNSQHEITPAQFLSPEDANIDPRLRQGGPQHKAHHHPPPSSLMSPLQALAAESLPNIASAASLGLEKWADENIDPLLRQDGPQQGAFPGHWGNNNPSKLALASSGFGLSGGGHGIGMLWGERFGYAAPYNANVLPGAWIADAGVIAMGGQQKQGLFHQVDHFPGSRSESKDEQSLVLKRYDEDAHSQTPPSNNCHHHEHSHNHFDAPISSSSSSSSSSSGGAVRTSRHGTQQKKKPYTRQPAKIPRLESETIWRCRWKGCTKVFLTLEELEEHLVAPRLPDSSESGHNLPHGHSKHVRCHWDGCTASVDGIVRHIESKAHLFVIKQCPSCGEWSTRKHPQCS